MEDITVIITAHANAEQLEQAIQRVKKQSRQPKQIIAMYSDLEPKVLHEDLVFVKQKNMKDWGHTKREMGIKLAYGQYLLFWNADDIYDDTFLTQFMYQAKQTKADFVYGDFETKGRKIRAQLQHGKITSGCYIVKTEIAKKAGYPHRVYEGDWLFIKDCLTYCNQIDYKPGIL